MTHGASSDDDRFAELLDQYATAYRDAVADAFWQAHPCDEALRKRILDAHQGLLQLESFITKRVQQQAIDTPQDAQLGHWLRQPTQLGRFQIVRELGRGGFGIVYLANDPSLGRQVAIKLPRMETLGSQSLQNRFAREAEIAAKLDHPHIVPVFEVGKNYHDIFIVSLYCPGTNLAQWLAENKQRLTQNQIVDLMIAICEAMGYCHQKNVLHRDLKPANVLLFPSPFASLPFLPRINDFGLAKVLESTLSETASSALVGTPLYMAPEQASSQFEKVCPATDVYGIGAVLYELLTGQPPFRGTITEILDQIRGKLPTRPRAFDKNIPLDLETICLKCLAKRVEDRYASAVELLADLRAFQLGRPIKARRLSFAQTFGRYAARNPGLLTTSALLVCACAAGIYIAATAPLKPTAPQQPTLTTPERAAPTEQELAASYEKYASDLRRVFDWLKAGKRPEAQQNLDSYGSPASGLELRTFGWRWLNARANYQPVHYEGLTGEALCADIARNMQWIAAGDSVGNIQIWNRDGELVKALNYSDKEINAIAFSNNGKLLATAGQDSQIHLWQVGTWEPVAVLGDFNGTITDVCWSPDDSQLVSGSRQKNVSVWDLAQATRVKRFRPVDDTVRSVKWSDDGQFIAANVGNGTSLWRVPSWEHIKHFPVSDFTLHGLAFSPDSQQLLATGFFQKLAFIDLNGVEPIKEVKTGGHMRSVHWSPDGRFIAGGAGSGQPMVWKAEDMSELGSLEESDCVVRGCKFAYDSHHLLTVHQETRQIKLWSLAHALGFREHWPTDPTLAWQQTDKGLCTVSGRSNTRLSLIAPQESTLVEIPGATSVAALSTSARLLARCYEDQLEIWDVRSGALKMSLPKPTLRVVQLRFLLNDTRLLVHADTDGWALYDLEQGKLLMEQPSKSPYRHRAYCFSGDEERMVVRADADGEMGFSLRSVRTGEVINDMNIEPGTDHLVGNYDLSKLYGYAGDRIEVYDIISGQRDTDHFHTKRNIKHLALSPDGLNLAACVAEKGLYLWDVRTGQELFPIFETATEIDQLRFTSNTELVCHRNAHGIDGILIFTVPAN